MTGIYTTLRHRTATGEMAERRTQHDYTHVRLRRIVWDNATKHVVVGWHSTPQAAHRAKRLGQWVEAVNDGER